MTLYSNFISLPLGYSWR